ncbi:TetR/AcrR family transcriptional regulator [Streptomyces sp. B21-108]|uniref:TetR/AcrR family transcriptional regulator n=1 Tax=Streptomyces sp. B21-108 TaxID=3039419 RepID=UPI002FF119DA
MRVTRAQAEQNRAHIVATAARLFRERGYDGVGVAELMATAGFTHGGFYKHFRSKAGLMAEASASGLSQTAARAEGVDPAEFVESYVSREHRDGRSDGCTIAALSGDAARQPADIKTEFAAGIENLLTALQTPSDTPGDADQDQRAARTMVIDMLAHSIGAIMLSRACPDDSPLADEILDVCRKEILVSLAHGSSDQPAALSPEA